MGCDHAITFCRVAYDHLLQSHAIAMVRATPIHHHTITQDVITHYVGLCVVRPFFINNVNRLSWASELLLSACGITKVHLSMLSVFHKKAKNTGCFTFLC